MRSFFIHSIASCRNLNDISSASRVGGPHVFISVAVLASFRLWVTGIFLGMSTVRYSYIICVEDELFTFSEVQNTFVRSSPIIS